MDAKKIAERFMDDLWNRHNLAAADELFAEDCVTHQLRSAPGPVPAAPRRPADVKRELAGWFAAFPDIALELEERVAEGDVVVSRYLMRGTHTGEWLGVPATGKPICVRMAHTIRVRDGKIVEDWLLAEWHGMLEQLGLLPSLAEALARPPKKA